MNGKIPADLLLHCFSITQKEKMAHLHGPTFIYVCVSI